MSLFDLSSLGTGDTDFSSSPVLAQLSQLLGAGQSQTQAPQSPQLDPTAAPPAPPEPAQADPRLTYQNPQGSPDPFSGLGGGFMAALTGAHAPQGYVEHDPKHMGMAGTAHDILGTLGDFLLTRLHMKPMYGPAQDSRKLSAALSNYDADPIGAIQQATDVDPEAGMKWRNQYTDNQRLAATQAETAEYRNQRMQSQRDKDILTNRGVVARYINSIGSSKMSDDQKAAAYDALRPKLLSTYGGDKDPNLETLLPNKYDPIALGTFADSGESVGQARSQAIRREQGDRGLDIRQDGLDERTRHDRANESNANIRISIAQDKAKNGGRAKPIMKYAGDDGYYHVQMDDGTDVVSKAKVRPTGKPSILQQLGGSGGSAGPVGAPPPRKAGDKIRGPGGKIYVSHDGKTWQ